jgi:anti-anti-sigma regulatory factor/pSer/pThr/pTyr-binding forkhead associated (FHA) protein
MKYHLIVAKGDKKGLPVPVDIDLFLVGSGKMCQIRPHHETVGELHFALARRHRKVFIRDLNSGHATFVNGDVMPECAEWPLHSGDFIEFGPFALVIQFHENTVAWRNMEEWSTKSLDLDGSRRVKAIDILEAMVSRRMKDSSETAAEIIDQLAGRNGVVVGRLRISREEGITVVRVLNIYLVDEAELAAMKKDLQENLNRNFLRILLDMKDVQRMSTAAAMMLGNFAGWVTQFGSKMAMCRLRPDLRTILRDVAPTAQIRHFREKETAMTKDW